MVCCGAAAVALWDVAPRAPRLLRVLALDAELGAVALVAPPPVACRESLALLVVDAARRARACVTKVGESYDLAPVTGARADEAASRAAIVVGDGGACFATLASSKNEPAWELSKVDVAHRKATRFTLPRDGDGGALTLELASHGDDAAAAVLAVSHGQRLDIWIAS